MYEENKKDHKTPDQITDKNSSNEFNIVEDQVEGEILLLQEKESSLQNCRNKIVTLHLQNILQSGTSTSQELVNEFLQPAISKGWLTEGGPQSEFLQQQKRRKSQKNSVHQIRDNRKVDEKGRLKRIPWTDEEVKEMLISWHKITNNGTIRPWRLWRAVFLGLPEELQKIRNSKDLRDKVKVLRKDGDESLNHTLIREYKEQVVQGHTVSESTNAKKKTKKQCSNATTSNSINSNEPLQLQFSGLLNEQVQEFKKVLEGQLQTFSEFNLEQQLDILRGLKDKRGSMFFMDAEKTEKVDSIANDIVEDKSNTFHEFASSVPVFDLKEEVRRIFMNPTSCQGPWGSF